MGDEQPDYSGYAMVALYPPAAVANQLWRADGQELDSLHCTVAYLGAADDVDLETLLAAVTPLAVRAPVDATISGHARFTGEEQDVLVALVDAPALEQIRRDLVDALTAAGIGIPSEHGYTPHITITYLAAETPSGMHRQPPVEVRFPALTIKHGKQRIDLLFGGDPVAEAIVPYARTAYAQGWAASGGPMTDHVRAGCVAAVENAVEHVHDPHILEVTFQLGHLEGVWATVYARRETLYAKHVRIVTAAWRNAARRLDLTVAIRRYRASLGLTETTSDDQEKTHRLLIAKAIARAVLYAIASPEAASPDARDPIITAIADALKDAQAEGWAAAVAVSADRAATISIDFDLPFEDAWKALGDLGTYWGDAAGWLAEITAGLTGDLGAALGRLGAEGATFDEMLAAAEGVLTGVDVKAVTTILDMAMSQSFSRGALALYRREGVQTVDFITAGGVRVCPVCEDHEAKNPWAIADVPHPAIHPHCRCVLAAANPLEALDFLTPYIDISGGEGE